MNIKWLNDAIDFVGRYSLLLILLLAGIAFIGWEASYVMTLAKSVIAFALVVLLAGVGLYTYTKIEFTKIFIKGKNERTDTNNEYLFSALVMAAMILAAAYTVGAVVNAVAVIENSKSITSEELKAIQQLQESRPLNYE